MGLLSAYSILGSSFDATAAQIALVSRNIANAGTAGTARKTVSASSMVFGGVQLGPVMRAADNALRDQVFRSTANAASANVLADALAKLSSIAGAGGQSGSSLDATIATFRNALQAYDAAPGSGAMAQAGVAAATALASSFNAAATSVQELMSSSDSAMNSSVERINSLLSKFGDANRTIVAGLAANKDVSDALDSRDDMLRKLSEEVGVTTNEAPDGSLSIYTDSGVTLFEGEPRQVAFVASASASSVSPQSVVSIDGVPVTGAAAPMAVRSGKIAGLASARDDLVPKFQAQLDQIAKALIEGFAETDQSSTPSLLELPGLFTFRQATGMPTAGDIPGLARRLMVNPNVDPEQGGNVNLLRDGGIADPGNPAYTYNHSGASSFNDRIHEMLQSLSASRTFDQSAGIATSGTIYDFSQDSLAWVQSQYQHARDRSDFQKSVAQQAGAALGNATGVNLDAELNLMLSLENSYGATAKILDTVQNMFSALLNSVGR